MREITVYDLNLILQLIIFSLFLAGIYYMKGSKKSLSKHRFLMGMAVVLNAFSIFLIMGRSLLSSLGILIMRPYAFGPLVTWTHAVVGGCAEVLGVAFLRKHRQNVRFRMRIATVLWVVALLSGIAYYVYYYLL